MISPRTPFFYSEWNSRINCEAFEEGPDTLKEVNERIMASLSSLGRLRDLDEGACIKDFGMIHTERRTENPAKLTFAGPNAWRFSAIRPLRRGGD
jgi:hypothetical protein